ncbi:MAG: DNA/RNA non-specific endonuclease [Bacteroidales bacterium]|nr:DNA/RNA non-specific endonuclease [Bacteroidales bacterium]
MKRIALRLIPLAVVLFAAGCARTEIDNPRIPSKEEFLIHKTFYGESDETKTTLDGVNVLFAEGEAVSIYDGSGNREFTAKESGANVTFTGNVSAAATSYYVLSPYSASTVFSKSGSTVTAATTVPASQAATPGSFASGANLSAAMYDADDAFSLQNLLAVAKFTLSTTNLDGHSIASVTLSGAYPLAGDVVVTYGTECTLAAGSQTVNSVSLSNADGTALSDGTYYLTLLPNAGGEITLTFTATDGYTATRKATLSSAFTAGTIKNLGTVRNLAWESPRYYFRKVTTFPGEGTYLIVAETNGLLYAAKPIPSGNQYGYLKYDELSSKVEDGDIVLDDLNDAYTISLYNGGPYYRIRQSDGRYWWQQDGFNTVSAAEDPTEAYTYSFTASGGVFTILNVKRNKFLQYDTRYSSYGSYPSTAANRVDPSIYQLVTPDPKITTAPATNVTVSSAVLNATFSHLGTTSVQDAHFRWGRTPGNLDRTLYAEDFDVSSGAFHATLSGLDENTTIYYQAFLQYCTDGTNYVLLSGAEASFETHASSTGGNAGLQWLGCYEIPSINLQNENNYSGTGPETFGTTNWFNYLTTNSMQKVVTHTYSYGGAVYRNFTTLMDGNKRCPLWTAFPLHKDAYPDNYIGRVGSFSVDTSYDPAIPEDWQSSGSTSDYNGGLGYARGHHCASEDRQVCDDANWQTFYYTNQSPQIQNDFNGGVWVDLEAATRSAAPSGRDTLYVVVGTLFEDGNYGSSNDWGQVARPSHFYRLMMKCSFNSYGNITGAEGVAYLFENKAHPYADYNDSEFVTTIDAIETRTGFNFFANVPDAYQTLAENGTSKLNM